MYPLFDHFLRSGVEGTGMNQNRFTTNQTEPNRGNPVLINIRDQVRSRTVQVKRRHHVQKRQHARGAKDERGARASSGKAAVET